MQTPFIGHFVSPQSQPPASSQVTLVPVGSAALGAGMTAGLGSEGAGLLVAVTLDASGEAEGAVGADGVGVSWFA